MQFMSYIHWWRVSGVKRLKPRVLLEAVWEGDHPISQRRFLLFWCAKWCILAILHYEICNIQARTLTVTVNFMHDSHNYPVHTAERRPCCMYYACESSAASQCLCDGFSAETRPQKCHECHQRLHGSLTHCSYRQLGASFCRCLVKVVK